jgi:hypothetical protein
MSDIQNKIRQAIKEEELREMEEWKDIFATVSATMAVSGIVGLIGINAYRRFISDSVRKAKEAADKYRRLRAMIVVTVEENVSKLTKSEILGLMKISSQRLTFEEVENTLVTLLAKKPKILDDILKRADPDGYAEIIKQQFPVNGRAISNDELATILAPDLQKAPEAAAPKPSRTRRTKEEPDDDLPGSVPPDKLN